MKRFSTFIAASLISTAAIAVEVSTPIPRAYQIIANAHGVPVDIFFAVALQESGKKRGSLFLPWPWTLNINGQSHYFDSREEAESALLRIMKKEAEIGRIPSVDVGIGQINMRAHLSKFESPLQALDPTINLNYAASYLAAHYVNTVMEGKPNWWTAVGRYHHPSNSHLAQKYRVSVIRRCKQFSQDCDAYGKTNNYQDPNLMAIRANVWKRTDTEAQAVGE